MRRLRKRWIILVAATSLCGALVLSGHGVLYRVTDTTPSDTTPSSDEVHGVIPTWRCHYVTGTGTFSFESTMEAYGDDVCYPLKRATPSSWKFRRASFF